MIESSGLEIIGVKPVITTSGNNQTVDKGQCQNRVKIKLKKNCSKKEIQTKKEIKECAELSITSIKTDPIFWKDLQNQLSILSQDIAKSHLPDSFRHFLQRSYQIIADVCVAKEQFHNSNIIDKLENLDWNSNTPVRCRSVTDESLGKKAKDIKDLTNIVNHRDDSVKFQSAHSSIKPTNCV